MAMIIEDGKGQGYKAAVGSNNKLETHSITTTEIYYVNEVDMQAYSVVVSASPAAGTKCVAYFKNLSATKKMVFNGCKISCSIAEAVQIYVRDTGTPSNTAALTAANRNTDSANVPDAQMYVEASNAGIGGLTPGLAADRMVTVANQASVQYDWLSQIILGTNGVLSIYCITSGGVLTMTLSFYFVEAHD